MTWRAPTPDDRRVAWLWACCAALAVALKPVWLAALVFVPGCPWHRWMGFACPGCGTSRALAALLRLDVTGAIAMNPLAASTAVAFLMGGVLAPFWITLGGPVPEPDPGPKPGWGIAAVAGVGLNWAWLVARNV